MKKHWGIVFAGADGPEPQMLRRLLAGAEVACAQDTRAPLLAAADSGLILAEKAGLRPDWIIGDMDSLDSEERLRAYPAERVIRHCADKDYTDTELAIDLLREKGCDEIWIAGGGGGRIAHIFGIRDLFEREYFPRRWITAAEDIHCMDGAVMPDERLTLAVEQGTLVSVFPLGNGQWKAESTGLKWPLDNVRWERGLYGLSNVAIAPKITINARKGRFMIITEELCRRT